MNPSDNIGLTDFLVLVYKFFKRNFLIISSVTIIGLVIGLVYTNQKQNYYSSEMIGFSHVIENTTLLEVLAPLTTLSKENNYEELSSILGISISEASQIRLLNFANSRHTVTSHAPSVTDKSLGKLIVVYTEVYDQKVLSKLEEGINTFLASNEYLSKTLNSDLTKSQNLIDKISKNILFTDSLNRKGLQNSSNSKISIQGKTNPVNYNEALIQVENLKIRSQVLQPFTTVSSFYKVKQRSNKPILIIITATIAFFSLSLLIVFVKELAQLAKD